MIAFTVFAAIITLIVSAISIAAIYALRLYKKQATVIIVPIVIAVTLGLLGADNLADWRNLVEETIAPLVFAPPFVWLFFRKKLNAHSAPSP